MRIVKRTGASSIGLLALAGCLSAGAGDGPGNIAISSTPPLAELRARCPTTRNLAPSEFEDPPAASATDLDAREARIRGPARVDPPPAEATIAMRGSAGLSPTQGDPSETATTVWRMPDGSWHFRRIEHYVRRHPNPPPPQMPALSPTQIEAARREVTSGRLDSAQAATLDRLMADPCLEAEPIAIGPTVNVNAGVEVPQPCFDGTWEELEIVRGGRRTAFRQYCHKFLVGEALSVVVYPRVEDVERAPREANQVIASVEEARRRGDSMIAQYQSQAAWENVTTTRTTELRHRPTGFRCAFGWDPSASVFGTPEWEAPSLSANCYTASYARNPQGVGWRRVQTRTIIRRPLPGKDLRYTIMDAAPQHISEAWRRRPILYDIDQARIDGRRIARAALPDFSRADAREEEFSLVLGIEIDGWIVVQQTSGRDTKANIERIALKEWRRLMASRGSTGIR